MRYSGTSSTTDGMNSVASTAPFRMGAYRGLSTDSTYPPVVAINRHTNHEPSAITIVLTKYLPTSTSTQAWLRFAQSMPFGQSASGVLIVSCVEVTAAFAGQMIGPSPASTSPPNRNTCTPRIA